MYDKYDNICHIYVQQIFTASKVRNKKNLDVFTLQPNKVIVSKIAFIVAQDTRNAAHPKQNKQYYIAERRESRRVKISTSQLEIRILLLMSTNSYCC